jgi:adenosylcobinamide-GDP ribazoletransferase
MPSQYDDTSRQGHTMTRAWLDDLATGLKIGVLFSTRIPLAQPSPITGGEIARASWALPLAGLLVGLLGSLTYWAAHRLGLASLPAASLALAATMLATGCLHEDALADTVDGFGACASRERKLDVMRDSRIGAYAACALALSLLLRVDALASIAAPSQVALALVAAHAGARAMMPAFLLWVPPARMDGLSADAGRPPQASVFAAALLGTVLLMVGLGATKALVALLLLAAAFVAARRLCLKTIGGQTGDVTGALEQAAEIIILLVAAAA